MPLAASAHYSDIFFKVADHVATITINRPQQLNAFTPHTLAEIGDALARSGADRAVGAVVITGVGERAFSSGGDINSEMDGDLVGQDWHLGRQIVDCPKPVIARVSGYAIGGGNHLAYFCDVTIAAEHSVFGQNGPRVGAAACGYVVAHAASVLGHKRAREMWLFCRRYSARQALEWGLVNAVVPQAELDTETARWCQELLALSPTALRTVKASFREHMQSYMGRNVSDMLRQYAPEYIGSEEQKEGARAFLEKRRPDFSPWR